MMQRTFLLSLACLFSAALSAQVTTKNVTVHFNQVHNNYKMAHNYRYHNWEGIGYQFTRNQFYTSQFGLIHNNGDTLYLPESTVVLTDETDDAHDLGTWDLAELEGIVFHVGVPDSLNHADPASWPAGHPLAPRIPDMHWGWAAGYRFCAFEGGLDVVGDFTYSTTFQYHGVGDQFFTPAYVATSGVETGNQLDIYINADFRPIFQGIDMENMNFLHGDSAPIPDLFNNMETEPVFTEGDGTDLPLPPDSSTGIDEFGHSDPATAFPNPFNHQTQVQYDFGSRKNLELVVADLYGRVIQTYTNLPSKGNQMIQMDDAPAGMYMYYLQDDSGVLFQDKITYLK